MLCTVLVYSLNILSSMVLASDVDHVMDDCQYGLN